MELSTRIAAAAFILAGGLVHLQLWEGGYRGIPYVGPSFLALAVVSGLLAVALAVPAAGRARAVAAVGIAVSTAALAALVMSRTVGVFGFVETTWSPQALEVLAAELGALVACAALLAPSPPLRVTALPGPGQRHPR